MAEPFLSEIRLMSFVFAPKGWALCNGQLLPINQNQALFALLGTSYGGDGRVNFALPDLRGRSPLHQGSGYTMGQAGGEAAHTLTLSELPPHAHALRGSETTGRATAAAGNVFAAARGHYAPSGNVAMALEAMSNVGGSQAHENMAPYLTLNFVIALQGIFPSQN